jgi:Na+-translocating ferredoxin:NAD+ oxidoreductase subunit B
MLTQPNLIKKVDHALPQTQCGLCGYSGCLPYATAIVEQHESIDRCPPGGIETLSALASLTQQDATPYLTSMQEKTKASLQAIIREAECIGCTKCIQACPVDAIVGAAKQMHTVLISECTGCALCVDPCPVDCIDMLEIAKPLYVSSKARARFRAREKRLSFKATRAKAPVAKNNESTHKAYILAAVARVKEKRGI